MYLPTYLPIAKGNGVWMNLCAKYSIYSILSLTVPYEKTLIGKRKKFQRNNSKWDFY